MPYAQMTVRARLAHKLRDGLYRAKKAGCMVTVVTISDVEKSGLLTEDKCYYCGIKLDGRYTLEHKKPLVHGGFHTLDNLAKACQKCNQDKHIQEELDYISRLCLEEVGNCE